MKKVVTIAICLFVFCAVAVPSWAGGGKVQHENEQEKGNPKGKAIRAGSNAQGNQVN